MTATGLGFCRHKPLALALFLGLGAIAATHAQPPSILALQQKEALATNLTGAWVSEDGRVRWLLTLGEDGHFSLNEQAGDLEVFGTNLILRTGASQATYAFQLSGETLTLSGGDMLAPQVFTRLPEPPGYLTWLSHFSPESLRVKCYRIATIAGIVLVSRLILLLIRGISYLMIFSERGPLRFLYRHRKNRARTLHLVTINMLKYVIYFVALGYILAELGINYTAYLASLSVVGLAIGFGSQGLVQDMVNGFFLLLEGQFDVGDMVEISGQTGVVEELDLRMTKIRSYHGKQVLVPNRGILVVGRYTNGCQEGFLDVPVESADAAREHGPRVEALAVAVAQEFEGVFLSPPKVTASVGLGDGEALIRLQFGIWPQQEWVIDQQLVPRLRDGLARSGIRTAGDRLVVFYHVHREVRLPDWRQALRHLAAKKGLGHGPV